MGRLAIALGLAGIAACRREAASETRREANLRRAIAAAIRTPVDRVRCRAPDRCDATVGAITLPVRVRDAGTELAWELDGLVLHAADLEAAIEGALAELDQKRDAACGARVRIVQPGEQVTCQLSGSGRAWARIDAAGTADIEIALESTVVSARSEGLADSELDALSRALDRDGASGD